MDVLGACAMSVKPFTSLRSLPSRLAMVGPLLRRYSVNLLSYFDPLSNCVSFWQRFFTKSLFSLRLGFIPIYMRATTGSYACFPLGSTNKALFAKNCDIRGWLMAGTLSRDPQRMSVRSRPRDVQGYLHSWCWTTRSVQTHVSSPSTPKWQIPDCAIERLKLDMVLHVVI